MVHIIELADQLDGVGGGDEYVGKGQCRDQQGSPELVDARDDELGQRSDSL